jgi:hypothetical protein
MARARANVKLVALAIKEAGTTDVGAVSLKLEEILDREMLKTPSYQKRGPKQRQYEIFSRLERMGIETSGDIKRLIQEVEASA